MVDLIKIIIGEIKMKIKENLERDLYFTEAEINRTDDLAEIDSLEAHAQHIRWAIYNIDKLHKG